MACIVYRSGARAWYIKRYSKDNDYFFHRLDGPATIWLDGTTEWYQNNKLHRLDGPAVEYSDGDKEYWINDGNYTKAEWKKYYGM